MNKSEESLARSLRRAHTALLDEFHKLEGIVRSAAGTATADLSSELQRVRARLAEHFQFEEVGGYMDTIRVKAPHREREIQLLQDDHQQLDHSLGQLIADCRASTKLDETLREKVRAWIRQVHQHESH